MYAPLVILLTTLLYMLAIKYYHNNVHYNVSCNLNDLFMFMNDYVLEASRENVTKITICKDLSNLLWSGHQSLLGTITWQSCMLLTIFITCFPL